MLTQTSAAQVLPWLPSAEDLPGGQLPREPAELLTAPYQKWINRLILASFLGISEKTLDRRFRKGSWDQAESYRLGLLLSLRQQATEVFGDAARASTWLQTPVPALDNQAPVSLLDSVSGFERARNTLLRQAYGMY